MAGLELKDIMTKRTRGKRERGKRVGSTASQYSMLPVWAENKIINKLQKKTTKFFHTELTSSDTVTMVTTTVRHRDRDNYQRS